MKSSAWLDLPPILVLHVKALDLAVAEAPPH